MELLWKLSDSDIIKIRDYVKNNSNPDVEKIIKRNINHIDAAVDKDSIINAMLICLLSSETDSYPENIIRNLFHKKPHLLTYRHLSGVVSIEHMLLEFFQAAGITKFMNKVPKHFASNFDLLVKTNWELESEIKRSFKTDLTKSEERNFADRVDKSFKGFGSKEARSFLLALGVTKYEIPIDNKLIKWLKNLDFPVRFSKIALQDIYFYHFISDGIQKLCEISEIYPCVLYASILSDSEVLRQKNNHSSGR